MRWGSLRSGTLSGQWADLLGWGDPKIGAGARGSFKVAGGVVKAVFFQGRVLQGPDDSRPGERLRVRCEQPGGQGAGVMGFCSCAWW